MSTFQQKSGAMALGTRDSRVGRWTVISVWCVLSCYCSALWAAETRVSISRHPGFEQLRHNLQALVEAEGTGRVSQHFFIATYPPDREYTYMLWREGRVLWILDLADEASPRWESVIATPRGGTRINLDLDVVGNPGTSTYLVGTAWVKSIIYDAVLNGDLVVVNRNP